MERPLFTSTLVRDDHVRSFQVMSAPTGGWEVTERLDERRLFSHRHTDWQRVEMTLRRFASAIAALKNDGWRETRSLA
jgi:hypothetical protein